MALNESFNPTDWKEIAGNRMKAEKWTGNILRYYAEKMYEHPISMDEVWKIDMTNKYFKEIDREIKNHEILKQQVNAKMRMGKSTVAIGLGIWVLRLINDYFPKLCPHQTFSMKNLCRDDQEKTKAMRNPDLMYTILVTDENNELEKTGENATTESAQKEVFSDVQAGRYVHNIDVCPEGEIDKNADIKLEVRNRENGMCHCHLYYKLNGDWIGLGFVDIDVSGLIKNWKRVEPRFMRYLKFKEDKDRKYIEYWSKKDFYVEYMIKKYEKMELMNREGILRPRELDYAGVVLDTYNKVKGLVNIMSLQQIKLTLQSYVEFEFKRHKLPVSMVGVEFTTRRVLSLLTIMKTKKDLKDKLQNALKSFNKGKINEDEYSSIVSEVKEHEEELTTLLQIQLDELNNYKKINEKYNSHLEPEGENRPKGIKQVFDRESDEK